MAQWVINWGVAGVSDSERPAAQLVERIFAFTILIVLFVGLLFSQDTKLEFATKQDIRSMMELVFQLCVIVEFVTLLILTEKKWLYVRSNWMMLFVIFGLLFTDIFHVSLLVIPLKLLRLLMIGVVIIPTFRVMTRYYFLNSLPAIFAVSCIITFLFGVIVSFIDPNMKTGFDGIWWAIQTVTTVGYGDVVPQTFLGRIIGMILMIIAVGMFVSITSRLSALLTTDQNQRQNEPSFQLRKTELLSEKVLINDIASLSEQLSELHKKVDDLQKKLDR